MSDSLIKRTKRERNFSILGNEIFNCGLKADTLGVLAYILHLPDNWIIRKTQLCAHFKIGREKIDRIFKDLKEAGFIADIMLVRGPSGRFDGVNYLVYDVPIDRTTGKPATVNRATGKPLTEKPYHGKSARTNNYILDKELNIPSTNITSTNNSTSTKVDEDKTSAEYYEKHKYSDDLWYLD